MDDCLDDCWLGGFHLRDEESSLVAVLFCEPLSHPFPMKSCRPCGLHEETQGCSQDEAEIHEGKTSVMQTAHCLILHWNDVWDAREAMENCPQKGRQVM